MPKKFESQFDFQPNPEKNVTAQTLANYKRHLNHLAQEGIKNKDDILNNPQKVVDIIKKNGNTQVKKNFYYASVFYATGRQDYEKDPRGLPIFKAFQENYNAQK